jgi:hypothetical protein
MRIAFRSMVYDATERFLIAVGHRQDLHNSGWTRSDNYLTARGGQGPGGVDCQTASAYAETAVLRREEERVGVYVGQSSIPGRSDHERLHKLPE